MVNSTLGNQKSDCNTDVVRLSIWYTALWGIRKVTVTLMSLS